MPCFHFDLCGERLPREGLQLEDMVEARMEATKLAGTLLAQDPARLWRAPEWCLDVTNCDGEVLFTIGASVTTGSADAIPNEVCQD